MTLFIILPLGALYVVMFILISICFLAFLYALVHSWCKRSQLELRNYQFCVLNGDVPCGLGANLLVRLRQPLREGFAQNIHAPGSATRGSSHPKPTGTGSAPHSGSRDGARGCRALAGDTQLFLYLTMNTRVFAGLL